MIRVQTNVVLKYFEPIDEFIRIRIFTPEEARKLLKEARITDRQSYTALVLNACLLHYNDQLVPRLREAKGDPERALFDCVVEVNPHFDLKRVVIEVPSSETSSIHLLESEATPARDFTQLRTMEQDLGEAVIGQEPAISSVTRAIRKSLTGLRDQDRPIASFFFVGQTGVGKTELAKALTRYLYTDDTRMLRVDCSEFALPHEYAKLTGAPPGYVGHDEGGLLSEARKRGTPVVLFDEVEKSDTKVHNLLLQLMDEGFVTDNKAQRIEFRDAIIILTSNLGAEEAAELRDRIGFDSVNRKVDSGKESLSAVRKFFRPEFINRLSEVVVFGALDIDHCQKIADRFLGLVCQHAAGVPLTIKFGRRVARFLAERAFNPEFGAREVRRTVEREVEDRLSEMLIEGHLNRGDKVSVRVRKDRLDFTRN